MIGPSFSLLHASKTPEDTNQVPLLPANNIYSRAPEPVPYHQKYLDWAVGSGLTVPPTSQNISVGAGSIPLQHSPDDPLAQQTQGIWYGMRQDGLLHSPQGDLDHLPIQKLPYDSPSIDYRMPPPPPPQTSATLPYVQDDTSTFLAPYAPSMPWVSRGGNSGRTFIVNHNQVGFTSGPPQQYLDEPDHASLPVERFQNSMYHPLRRPHPSDSAGKELYRLSRKEHLTNGSPSPPPPPPPSSVPQPPPNIPQPFGPPSIPVIPKPVIPVNPKPSIPVIPKPVIPQPSPSVPVIPKIPGTPSIPIIPQPAGFPSIPVMPKPTTPVVPNVPVKPPVVPKPPAPKKPSNCHKSKYGCCPDGKTTKKDAQGSNCPKKPVSPSIDISERGLLDDMRLLSGNQVLIDRKPVIINVSYHGNSSRQPWERTPDYYNRQFENTQPSDRYYPRRHHHNHHHHHGYHDANFSQCRYRNSLGDWYDQNEMEDADPSTTIDGDRLYLTGRRWHSGRRVESMTDNLLEYEPTNEEPMPKQVDTPLTTLPPQQDQSQPVRKFVDRSWSAYQQQKVNF